MKYIFKNVVLLFSIICLFPFIFAADEKPEPSPFTTKKTTGVKGVRIDQIAEVLSKAYEMPVCVEEARWFTRDNDPPATKTKLAERRRGYTVAASNETLSVVLDRFVKEYPEYKWAHDKETNTVNIYPAENPYAENLIRKLDLKNESISSILLGNDLLNLAGHEIDSSLQGGGSFKIDDSKIISLQADSISIRSALNKIFKSSDLPRYWIILEIRPDLWAPRDSWDPPEKRNNTICKWRLFFHDKKYKKMELSPEMIEYYKSRGIKPENLRPIYL